MKRMAGHYVYVWREMIFECLDFGVLAGCLATHDSILLGRYFVLSHLSTHATAGENIIRHAYKDRTQQQHGRYPLLPHYR